MLEDDDGNCRLRIVVHSTDVCSVTQQCRSSSKNVSRNRHVSVERRIGWGRRFASADLGICVLSVSVRQLNGIAGIAA